MRSSVSNRQERAEPSAPHRLPCPSCGTPMWLSVIEPYAPQTDLRRFECTSCGRRDNRVVKWGH